MLVPPHMVSTSGGAAIDPVLSPMPLFRQFRHNWFIKPVIVACKSEARYVCSAIFSNPPVSGEALLQCLGSASSEGGSSVSARCSSAVANVTANLGAMHEACDADASAICPEEDVSSLQGMHSCLVSHLQRLSPACLTSVSTLLAATLAAAAENPESGWHMGGWQSGMSQGGLSAAPAEERDGAGGSGYSLLAAAAVGAASAGVTGLALAAVAIAARRRLATPAPSSDGAAAPFAAFTTAPAGVAARRGGGGGMASEPPLLKADSLA